MKKVLVITYYWPPSGGGGVQRWLKFTKYLPEYGWDPIVLTPSNPSVLEQDHSLENEISNEIEVIKIPIWEPYSITSKLFNIQSIPKQGIVGNSKDHKFSLLTWLRGNLLIPDTRIFWRKPAVRKSLEIIDSEKIDLIVTTGPPHSLHLVGLDLKRKCGVTWVADFRDPWSDWDMLDKMKVSAWAKKSHINMEQKVVKAADGVITVSNAWANNLSKMHHKPIKVLTNGYEKEATQVSEYKIPEKFRISHFGLINEFRNVPIFWATLVSLCEENESFRIDLEIFLAGNIEQEILDGIKQSKIAEKTEIAGYLPHESLAKEYQKTAVFLLLSNKSKNADGHIPGKLFEYLHFGRPVFAFCSKKGDVAHIIQSTNSGYALDSEDAQSIKSSILQLYENFKRKDNPFMQKDLAIYDRRNLSKELSEYFNQLSV